MEVLEKTEVNEQENGTAELSVVKKESFISKAAKGVKKHGKEIVGAVLLTIAGVAVYGAGKKAGSKQQDEDCEDLVIYDLDSEDIPDDETEE